MEKETQKNTSTVKRGVDFSSELAEKKWYHSFELPDGEIIQGHNTIEILKKRYSVFPLPKNLAGKTVLDIGAWDGWFSFEAEKRGAKVTAVDCVELPNFLYIHKKLASKVDYKILDVYELPSAGLGKFDYVFFLGVLYHLKHPLLALEIVCSLTKDVAIIDSFVVDDDMRVENKDGIPWMEFYETDELGGQLDNWIGPSISCLLALCRAAGFARVKLLNIMNKHACVACYRKWEPFQPDAQSSPPPTLLGVCHCRNFGINFSSHKDEYMDCRFSTSEKNFSRKDVLIEVDGFGIETMYLKNLKEDIWQANCRLPPGLSPDWKDVRVRLMNSNFSNPFRIAVDIPLPKSDHLIINKA